MAPHDYLVGDVPCYSQWEVRADVRSVVEMAGSGLLSLLGLQDYVLGRPPAGTADDVADRMMASGTRQAPVEVASVAADAAALGLRCAPLDPASLDGDSTPALACVGSWDRLVPTGPPENWIIIRRVAETHVEVNDVAWRDGEGDWAAFRWTPGGDPRDPRIYGAVRRIPRNLLVPLLRAGALFTLTRG